MPQLHYLDLADGSPGCALDELDRRLPETLVEGFVSVPQLQAVAEGLALQPMSPKACKMAEKIGGALAAHQRPFLARPSAGFPLAQAEEMQMRAYAFAWRALGRTYARWCFAQGHPIEVGWLAKAIACLRQIARLHVVYHCRLPEGLWLDLHALFRLAQQAEPSGTKGRWSALRRRAAPQEEYFRAQLLRLADPYSLLPQEVILIDSLLEKWTAMVKIADDAGEGWRLDENADTPAIWGAAGDGPRLDLTGLAALFADCRQFASPIGRFESWERVPETIPAGLLKRLERSWFQPPSKPRGGSWLETEWVVGLEDIFTRLEGKAMRAIWARMEAGRAKVTEVPSGSLQVGDLVGVFAIGGSDLIGLARVGRIEWSVETQNLDVELETIPGKVFAVGIQPIYRARQPCAYQRGLLLADQGRLELLFAEQPLPESLMVRLLHGDKLYPVRLDDPQNPARRTLSYRCASAVDLGQK